MNLDAAVIFIQAHGTTLEQAGLEYILEDKNPAPEAIHDLLAGQHPEGGWSPFWAPDYCSLDATCFRLAQAEQIGISPSEPTIRRATGFLVQRQQVNGTWEESAPTDSLPYWLQSGQVSSRLYLTANCGFWLAMLTDASEPTLKAANYLLRHLGADGRLPSYLHTHWLAGGLWTRLGWQEPSARVINCLNSRLMDLSTSNLGWMLTTLLQAGYPVENALVQKAAARLEAEQRVDGRWASEDGESRDVHTTLEALRVLRLCGRLS